MFTKSAQYYDEIYDVVGRDYSIEVNKLHQTIQKFKRRSGNTLLDVACGTGLHSELLRKHYKVEGLDLDNNILKVAKKKHSKIRFHQGNMIDFNLNRQFDIITCLGSSIGYVKIKRDLRKAIKNMNSHLLPGGVLVIEPWFTPEQWNPGRVYALQVEKPDVKIIRMSYSGQRRKVSVLEFQYLFGTPNGIEHQIEIHELGLFTREEYLDAFQVAGLKVIYNKKGITGRGLYIGKKAV